MKTLDKLKTGDWNSLSIEYLEGDIAIVKIEDRRNGTFHHTQVKGLYTTKEKVLWEEVIGEKK